MHRRRPRSRPVYFSKVWVGFRELAGIIGMLAMVQSGLGRGGNVPIPDEVHDRCLNERP